MRSAYLSGLATLAATCFAQSYPLELIYQFENSFSGVGYVNIENVAVRSTNGQLLLNFVTGAIVAQLDPANPVPEVLVNISNAYPGAPGSLTGIAETGKDIYTVAAGDFVFGPQVPGGANGVPGSFSVWNVDLNGHEAKASKVVDIPEAGLLNGITTVEGCEDIVLIADSNLGAIWKVNVKTGTYSTLIQDPLLLPTANVNFGVNGLEAQGPYLYLTNSAQAFFGAIPIEADGTPIGPVTPFVYAPNGTFFDDFDLDYSGKAYLATPPNAVSLVTRESSDALIIAGGGDDQTLLGPTSAALKGHTLYVVTGGAGGPVPLSGQVFAIDVSASEKKRAKKWIA